MTKAIMIQGTGSNVGKSMIVAGLARAFTLRGLRVAPFKPQNMSNNAAVAADGGEIGRAQALQAQAAGLPPMVDMNPILLKPQSETGAQLVVRGARRATCSAREYAALKPSLMPEVLSSFKAIAQERDLVIIEGAGSPAETNLRLGDIANMGFACAAGVPVILTGDIDRGGVIAQMVGTHAVLDSTDNAQICGFIVNKFRGDPTLFDEGMATIAARTGWQQIGLLPHFAPAWRLPAEDVMDISRQHDSQTGATLKIAVPRLARIANFDDLDPLRAEPSVDVTIIEPGQPLPGDAQLVLIPGSKATIADLAGFRANGWDIDLAGHLRRGGHVLGICGGYQMLGKQISDPDGVEGPPSTTPGLGHLDVVTVLSDHKRLALNAAFHPASGAALQGYEIHMGETTGPDCARAWLHSGSGPEGAASADGKILGSYLHGLFSADAFRQHYLKTLGAAPSDVNYSAGVEQVLDQLAEHLEAHLDLDAILELAKPI